MGLVTEATFPDSPVEVRGQYLPLMYGTFAKNDMTFGGLSECTWIEYNKFCVADHVCDAVNAVWILDEAVGKLVKIDSTYYTTTLDDSGRTTVLLDGTPLASCYCYPTDILELQDETWTDYPFINGTNSHDRDDTTYMTIDSPSAEGTVDGTYDYFFHESLGEGGEWDRGEEEG